LKDVATVFINYIQGKIRKYPFCEGALQTETETILEPLVNMNLNKIFTINS
jgi:methylenetetrahydrofolate reductase (NADPH)